MDTSSDAPVAIITGAGQGVGRGVALAMASAGYRVALLGRTVAKCDAVAEEVARRGGTAVALSCDVTSRADVDAAVAATVNQWGRIDVLVNNAQTMVYESVRRLREDDMNSMWDSGPLATLRCMQAAFEQLRATKGSVVNMASGSGVLPQAKMAGYAMVKEAIRTLTRVTAVEWGRFGIRVNAVCPLAASPGFERFNESAPGAFEMVLPTIPLGRMGDAETDIGRAVVMLCSSDAAYITGTTLMVDGGLTYLR